MRKPVVDYRGFRLSRLREPQFAHLNYLWSWVGYFLLYFLTENLIPRETCYVIHSRLDDLIPFCEFFVIPYVFWYLLIVGSLLYFMLYAPDQFRNLSGFIIVTQVTAMVIYIAFPNRQDLRPEMFPRENFCTWILSIIYRFDTNTNVCPSLHVAYSVGIASTWLKEKSVHWSIRAAITAVCILICLSTAFVKQHSILDTFAAVPVCILAEAIVFGSWWKQKRKTKE